MGHEKVYGVCENKCFVEVYSKDEIDSNISSNDDLIRRMVLIGTGEEPIKSCYQKYQHSEITTIPYKETHFVANFSYMFDFCINLMHIPNLDTSNGTRFNYMFNNCTSLTRVSDLDVSKGTEFNKMFDNCTRLETFEDNPSCKTTPWQFGENISFKDCPLDRTSILKVFNGLKTVTGKTIRISSTTNGYLSDADKAIATNKGWTVQVG